jgi:hypothetical protein
MPRSYSGRRYDLKYQIYQKKQVSKNYKEEKVKEEGSR